MAIPVREAALAAVAARLRAQMPDVALARDNRGSIDPLMDTILSVALYDNFRAGTPMPLIAIVGATAGNRFLVTAPAARATGFQPGARDGLGQYDIAFQMDGADSDLFLCAFWPPTTEQIMVPVFTRREAERFAPPGSPRTYLLAPLTFRERQAFRAEIAREGGIYPPRAQLLDGLREAVRAASPGNAEELIAHIDTAEADPDGEDRAAQQRLATIEAACAGIPIYATLIAARQRYAGMLPWVAARHALRGWEGDALPTFARLGGLVPAEMLALLPAEEIEAVGSRAAELMQPDRAAEGNSEPPSSSPAIP